MEAAGKRWIIHGSRTSTFRIWNLADLHLGNRGVAKGKLKADIEAIRRDPYSFWLGGGDYADYISPRDRKRFDAEAIDPEILALCDLQNVGRALIAKVTEYLSPIKDKCLGLAFGNHEDNYMRENEQTDLHAALCHNLGVQNLRYSAIIDVVFVRRGGVAKPRLSRNAECSLTGDRRTLKILIHHGAGGAITKSGKANRLERFMNLSTADLCFIGHCHDANIMSAPVLDTDKECTRIVERKRLALMTGSYLQTYASGQSGYGERRGYPPSTLGAVWAGIKPETGELWGEVRA